MRHLDMGEGVSGRRNSQYKGREVEADMQGWSRVRERDDRT